MSGLAKILGGRTAPGVYHWTSSAPGRDVAHAVERARWSFVSLDTWGVEDKQQFLAVCHESFGFPEWFGRNFDALADALCDVRGDAGGRDTEGVLVLWDGWGPFARADRHAFDVAVDVFASRVDLERAGAFVVLLRGPGPDDTDLVELDPHIGRGLSS
jgi:hypothetical protein